MDIDKLPRAWSSDERRAMALALRRAAARVGAEAAMLERRQTDTHKNSRGWSGGAGDQVRMTTLHDTQAKLLTWADQCWRGR